MYIIVFGVFESPLPASPTSSSHPAIPPSVPLGIPEGSPGYNKDQKVRRHFSPPPAHWPSAHLSPLPVARRASDPCILQRPNPTSSLLVRTRTLFFVRFISLLRVSLFLIYTHRDDILLYIYSPHAIIFIIVVCNMLCVYIYI